MENPGQLQLVLSIVSTVCMPFIIFIMNGIRQDTRDTRNIVGKHCSDFELHCKRPHDKK